MVILRTILPWALLIILGVAWGATFSLAKIATSDGAAPLGVFYWQTIIGSIVVGGYAIVRRWPIPLSKNYLSIYLTCGILGSVIPGILYFYAITHVSAGVLAITISIVPILTFAVAVSIKIETGSWIRVAGIALGFISILILMMPSESLPNRSATLWVAIAILASASYAAENIVLATRYPKGGNSFIIVGGMLALASIIVTPIIILTDTFVPLYFPWGRQEWAIVSMAVVGVICYGIFLWLVINLGPIFASQTGYVITLSGVFWGIIIFGEKHSSWVWGSLILMLVALALVAPRSNDSKIAKDNLSDH